MKRLLRIYKKDGQDKLLPRMSLAIFDRSRTAAIIWLCLTVFGIFSYTTFLKREGFPSINMPYTMVSGTYFVDDAAKVDREVAEPLSELIAKDPRVKHVQTLSQSSFYNVTIQYDEGTDAEQASRDINQRIKDANVLPKGADAKAEAPKLGFTARGDNAVVSLYSKRKGLTQQQLVDEADKLTSYIQSKDLPGLESVSVVDPFTKGTDPVTGQPVSSQTKFDRYGERSGGKNVYYDAVSVGIMQTKGTDVIKLDDELQKAIDEYNARNKNTAFEARVSATYAHDIKDQISELQKSLLEGLLAVLVIGSLVIAIRASIITVIAMVTVLALTLGVLFVAGYTLNTITLFSLILCLGLIVDDTIIMVEAIDAQRRKRKDPRETVRVATKKVSRAMVAATSTAAISFAPLLFVGGILGSFIRAIPVTVITSLVISLLVALIFIPLFARYLLLGKKQMGAENVNEPVAKVESKIANFIGKPMLWAQGSRKKLMGVGLTAVLIGFTFIGAGGFLFQKVTFNIFPPSKDSNALSVSMNFPEGTTIQAAEKTADAVNKVVAEKLGDNFRTAAYYANAGDRTAAMTVNITPYGQRDITAPQLQKELNDSFKQFKSAKVKVAQLDAGPPPSGFSVRIKAEDRPQALRLAKDVNAFLMDKELTRPSGEKATIVETSISDTSAFTRNDGEPYIDVTANFDATDTTTLVTLAQTAVKDEFTTSTLQSKYDLDKDALNFDLGQEEENQESFATLALAFPALLFVIYLLLAIQFRSLAQPLLIFMAIPFSLFGITLGLYLTDNAFSFFAMLGFFALIGLSIKNTILLTDYANQLRRTGASSVEAAVGALGERFRPLIATSLTAVVSLIPLMLSSPFWEGLAVVLIFGLLSSTLLVLTVFPYYYLGAEFVRLRISRTACLLWLAITIGAIVVLSKAGMPAAIPLTPFVVALVEFVFIKAKARRKRKAAA